jgi:hypothetical protein
MQVTKRSEKEIVEHRFGRWDPNGRRSSPSYREGTSYAYLNLTASLRWGQSGTKGVSKNEKQGGIRHVLGRDDDRTRKIIRCCEAVKKQEARCHPRNTSAGIKSEPATASSKATLLIRGAGT